MTWSLSHTIPWSNEFAPLNHQQAWTYFFDTFLNGVSTHTTTHWPSTIGDGQIYRKLKITLTNKYTNAPYNMYFSIRLSDEHIELYIDSLYTVNPQDATSIGSLDLNAGTPELQYIFNMIRGASIRTYALTYPDGASTNFGDYKFWTSNENTDARLVTKGRRIVFYWPGWSSGYFYEDSNWDGSAYNNGQHVFGIIYSNNENTNINTNYSTQQPYPTGGPGKIFSKPSPHTGGSASEYVTSNSLNIDFDTIGRAQNSATKATLDYSTNQNNVLWTGWSTKGLNEDFPTFPAVTEPDVAVFTPHLENGEEEWFAAEEGTLIRVNNGDYWLTGGTDEFKEALAFNFGSTQPTF